MSPDAPEDRWRQTHLGRLLGHAMRRFDARVLQLMAASERAPLALSNLAARDKVGAAIVHVTRHLPLTGARLTELAAWAGMSKQAMGDLVDQCVAWGLLPVQRLRQSAALAWHHPPTHQALPATDQRQSRTIPPHPQTRMGLRQGLPQRISPPRRLDQMAQDLQPSQSTQRTRRTPTHHPHRQTHRRVTNLPGQNS